MQSPRAQNVRTLYLELRGLFATGPRSDTEGLARGREILKQLLTDPYASQQFHERIARVGRLLEKWFAAPTPIPPAAAAEVREALLLELAYLETEQRLRSWLMEIVR